MLPIYMTDKPIKKTFYFKNPDLHDRRTMRKSEISGPTLIKKKNTPSGMDKLDNLSDY